MPDTIEDLMKAFAKAQADMEGAVKGSTNPHFKSKYADLAEVISVVKEAFMKHGLCFIQPTDITEKGDWVVRTRVYLGALYFEGITPIIVRGSTAQDYGAALTYARRQGLQSLVGVPAEDDDGNRASLPKTQPQARERGQITPEPKPVFNNLDNPFDFSAPGLTSPKDIPVPCKICGTTLRLSSKMTSYYCPNFKNEDHKGNKPSRPFGERQNQMAGEADVP